MAPTQRCKNLAQQKQKSPTASLWTASPLWKDTRKNKNIVAVLCSLKCQGIQECSLLCLPEAHNVGKGDTPSKCWCTKVNCAHYSRPELRGLVSIKFNVSIVMTWLEISNSNREEPVAEGQQWWELTWRKGHTELIPYFSPHPKREKN